jgi:hypothetical protein
VRHLPGWYAQKHPDEDWAETFAVWMTPDRDWRADYAQLPTALAKLEFCDRTVNALAVREPLVTSTEHDEDVTALNYSLQEFYRSQPTENEPPVAAGLDGDLRTIFDDLIEDEQGAAPQDTRPAAELIRRLERPLMADVFRWTGHFPEKTRTLMRDLAKRADALRQVYPCTAEAQAIVGVTTLVTSLAMNFVHRGAYFPEAPGTIVPAGVTAPAAAPAPTAPGGGAQAATPPTAVALDGASTGAVPGVAPSAPVGESERPNPASAGNAASG